MRCKKPHRGLFLCLFEGCEDACTDTAGLRTGASHLVGVDVCGGGRIGVSQFCCGGDQVHAVGDHGRGCGVTEGMWMDVWQIICGAEFVQPIGNAVRVHDRAVILGEEKSGVLPNVRMEQFCTQLLGTILFKKGYGFRRKTDRTGTAGFGRTYINTLKQIRQPLIHRMAKVILWRFVM